MKKVFTLILTSLLFCVGNSFAQNLVVDYQLNGNFTDLSVNNNDLSYHNVGTDPTFGVGITAQTGDSSIIFTGGKGLVSIDSIDNSTWTGTAISIWVKNCVDGSILQGAYWGAGLQVDTLGILSCFYDGSSTGSLVQTNNVNLNDGDWHHIVAQNDGSTTYLYIDNQLDTSHTESLSTLSAPNSNAKIYLGITNLNTNKLEGELDNIKIFDGILSTTQIQNLYLAGDTTSTTTKVKYHEVEAVKLFPNPTADILMIDNKKEDWEYIKFIDINARPVLTQRLQTNQVNIEWLPSGVYFVHIQDRQGKMVVQQKIIKE
ncbi:MAG: LamG domain-containing protein [Saprospiraceae bacterium]|nr:LamG domain-containing protein [Saprospiraceae bacterium]